MKKIFVLIVSAAFLAVSCVSSSDRVVTGYVTSWGTTLPNPSLVTHLNYAFGHVADSFDSLVIDNEPRLAEIVALKEAKPSLKVLLSVGGWASGNFSEMAASDSLRASFCACCKAAVDRFGLDGIDIDWEYPTSDLGDISCSPDDKDNFTLLMRDLRAVLGDDALLSFAASAETKYINYSDVVEYVDFVNVMTYDMGRAPHFNAALYQSENHPGLTADQSVKDHLAAGVPRSKLVLGIPFYGRGDRIFFPESVDYKDLRVDGRYYEVCWDDDALVPYVANKITGEIVFSYENEKSILAKCYYIKDHHLRGAMVWDCGADDSDFTLSTVLWTYLKEK
ncbi:MAG: glycosyl hydrolase family 18 protein [Bacteroidia bacterium]|nr:glycosyl hydrolase family 18 protein [Bacteroidia bacterium]